MSPTPRPARVATRTAVAAAVLLALAGTGLAAAAVAPAVAATDAAPGSSARAAARAADPAPASTGSLARVVPAVSGADAGRGAAGQAAKTTTKATTQRCTISPAPSYTPGEVVQSTTFEDGTSVLPWAADRDLDEPLVVSSAAAHSGTGGLRAADIGAATLVYPISNTRTVGLYLIKFWVRESPDLVHASGAHLQVFVYDVATNATLASLEPQISGEWTLVQALVKPSVQRGICDQQYASAMKVVLYPVAPVCSDVAQLPLDIDDVSVAYARWDATLTPTTTAAVVRPACTRPPTTTTTTTTTTTSKPPASSSCKVKVARVMSWPGGSQLQVTLSSKAALSGWTLTAKVGSAQTAAYAWPGAVSQSGTQLTFTPLAGHADPLAAQTPTKFGLVLSGSNLPTGWAINGQACRVG